MIHNLLLANEVTLSFAEGDFHFFTRIEEVKAVQLQFGNVSRLDEERVVLS